MQDRAKLVIIGAGIVGASVAYHLTRLGWRDILVVDQGPLYETGGSTSHAPGLVFQSNGSKMMTHFAMYTVDLLSQLEHEGQPAWYGVGGIEVAYSAARLEELKRKQGYATGYGLEAHIITPDEVKAHIPLVDERVIHGGYWVPTDGDAKAVRAVGAMAEAAMASGGATFVGETKVLDVETSHGHVSAVITDKGRIECEMALLCTNIWSPVLAKKLGITVPLMAVEHLYAITTPIAELAGETREIVHPILRHQDHAMYFRQHQDRYGIGSYNHIPLLVEPATIGKLAMHPFTPEHFNVAWTSTHELLPATAATQIDTKFNGMFSFTTDGMPVLGPAPTIDGFWLAVGIWVTHSGGVGKAVAEWMDSGTPSMDLREADITRFHPHVFSRKYIHLRCATQYDEVYDIIHPSQQMENPRNLRTSPVFSRLKELNAVFFESAGWERPQWLAANARLLAEYAERIPERTGWEAKFWSPIQGAEHLAAREKAVLYDLGSFAKFEVRGPGATAFLEYMAGNRIDRPVGKVTYTALLNELGGIVCDLTITRLSEDRYWVLTGGSTGPHDLAWLNDHAPTDGSVIIEDISAKYATIGLWGPKARLILESVCEDDVSNAVFPYFTAKSITVDAVPCVALRLSYVGELGWELYAPMEYGLRLWDVLWEAGQEHGIFVGGQGAFDSLRLEKGYRSWGADIHTDYNPYEAGIGWAVRLNKGDFLGRDALLQAKAAGISQKLCCITLNRPDGMALGKEPILDASGKTVLGYVTSANYGYSVGKHIVYGYLPVEHAGPGTPVHVQYFGKLHPATVVDDPLFDAEVARLKA